MPEIAYSPAMIEHYFQPSTWVRDMCAFQLDDWQREQIDSPAQWQVWNCSRQSGKSTVAALLALHTATHFSNSLSLLIAPSLRQSGELFGKVREFYQQLPMYDAWRLIEDSALHYRIANNSRIVALPGAQETVRGYSAAKLVVLDEAAHCSTDLYRSLRPMLAVSGGRMVLPSTPFGKRGFFWDVWRSEQEGWEKRLVTANQCPRIRPEFLATEQIAQGDWFEQEYMGEFLDVRGGLFTQEMIDAMTVVDSEVDRIAKPWLPEDMSA